MSTVKEHVEMLDQLRPKVLSGMDGAHQQFYMMAGLFCHAHWPEIRDALSRAPQQSAVPEWQPIETLPASYKVGTLFLGYANRERFIAWRDYDDGAFRSDGEDYVEPTHWMPLPAAPTTKEKP